MISVNWPQMQREISDLYGRYQALPSYIAKKHILSSMRAAIRESKGTQLLRKNTPPGGVRRGRRKKGQGPKSTGALRKAVMVKAKWIGRNADGAAVAGLGYRYGDQSMKAIYLEFGTKTITPRAMVQKTFDSIRGAVAAKLSSKMAAGLEAAARELASGRNPGMSKRGLAMGMGG